MLQYFPWQGAPYLPRKPFHNSDNLLIILINVKWELFSELCDLGITSFPLLGLNFFMSTIGWKSLLCPSYWAIISMTGMKYQIYSIAMKLCDGFLPTSDATLWTISLLRKFDLLRQVWSCLCNLEQDSLSPHLLSYKIGAVSWPHGGRLWATDHCPLVCQIELPLRVGIVVGDSISSTNQVRPEHRGKWSF